MSDDSSRRVSESPSISQAALVVTGGTPPVNRTSGKAVINSLGCGNVPQYLVYTFNIMHRT